MYIVLGLRFSRWNKAERFWEIPDCPGSLERMQQCFGERISQIVRHEMPSTEPSIQARSIDKNQILIISARTGRLKLIFGYNFDLSQLVKTIPYYQWNPKNKWWTIPYSEKFLDDVKCKIAELGWVFLYEEEDMKSEVVPKKRPLIFPITERVRRNISTNCRRSDIAPAPSGLMFRFSKRF